MGEVEVGGTWVVEKRGWISPVQYRAPTPKGATWMSYLDNCFVVDNPNQR